MSNVSEKYFFTSQLIAMKAIAPYAPCDNKLFRIPKHLNVTDKFPAILASMNNDPHKNNLLIGLNISNHIRSLNRTLSIAFAAHGYKCASLERSAFPDNTPQQIIDAQINQDDLVIHTYSNSCRDFIISLRIAVDQLLLLHPDNYLQNIKYDCIGNFFKYRKTLENDPYEKYCDKFLGGLNIAANYLKHHTFQFESLAHVWSSAIPSLLVMIEKKSKFDYQIYKKYFLDQFYNENNKHVLFWINFDFLVKGFDEFFKTINDDIRQNNNQAIDPEYLSG